MEAASDEIVRDDDVVGLTRAHEAPPSLERWRPSEPATYRTVVPGASAVLGSTSNLRP